MQQRAKLSSAFGAAKLLHGGQQHEDAGDPLGQRREHQQQEAAGVLLAAKQHQARQAGQHHDWFDVSRAGGFDHQQGVPRHPQQYVVPAVVAAGSSAVSVRASVPATTAHPSAARAEIAFQIQRDRARAGWHDGDSERRQPRVQRAVDRRRLALLREGQQGMPGELRDPRRVRIETVARHHVAEHRLAIKIGRQHRRDEDQTRPSISAPPASTTTPAHFRPACVMPLSSSAAAIHRVHNASSSATRARWKLAGDSSSEGRCVKARNTGADASELPA